MLRSKRTIGFVVGRNLVVPTPSTPAKKVAPVKLRTRRLVPSRRRSSRLQGSATMSSSTSASENNGAAGRTVTEESAAPERSKNRLSREKSPYLLQHQYNPIDWYPWGEEAFQKARAENKPIFLSVGYSTCHWCHVMAHESFEDEQIAKIVNDNYVAIKLDREERPDVDAVYMTYVQGTTGGGGWPMTVFMTPDLMPFVGATYLPPARFTMALEDIALRWSSMQDRLIEEGENVIRALRQYVAHPRSDPLQPVTSAVLTNACKTAEGMFDPTHGGFGAAPKFPRPAVFDALFTAHARDPKGEGVGAMAYQMALTTLKNIARGGICDHLGGGFHRYSVDEAWHVPHFEKMLSDQSQLVLAFLQAYQSTTSAGEKELFVRTVRGTLDYVARDMVDETTGAFYSAEDADSAIPFAVGEDADRKAEGVFYLWTQFDLQLVLGMETADLVGEVYNIRQDGNVPREADPQGELEGKNVLKMFKLPEQVAEERGMSVEEVEATLEDAKAKLFVRRSSRPKPHLDDKVLTSWNGLMIAAFARASVVLGDKSYGAMALQAANFLHETMWNGSVLSRSYREGLSNIQGFADDYASTIFAYLNIFELTSDASWIKRALKLQAVMDEKFWDEEQGGYFSTVEGDPSIVLRKKEDADSAESAPSSIAASNLLHLAALTGREEYLDSCLKCANAFSLLLAKSAFAMPLMASTAVCALDGPKRVVIAGDPDAVDTHAMVTAFYGEYHPHVALLRLGSTGSEDEASLFGEETADMVSRGGKATAYVCRGTSCMEPVTFIDDFLAQLKKLVI